MLLFCFIRAYLFLNEEVSCQTFWHKTIVTNFLHLMVLFYKVVINHFSKSTWKFFGIFIKFVILIVTQLEIFNLHSISWALLSTVISKNEYKTTFSHCVREWRKKNWVSGLWIFSSFLFACANKFALEVGRIWELTKVYFYNRILILRLFKEFLFSFSPFPESNLAILSKFLHSFNL